MRPVAQLFSADLEGITAHLVTVEADLNVGLHSFTIVGLADKAVSEAKERVNSALKNSGIRPPTRENRRITVNLAPADIRKSGSRFDVPIALAYLLASEQLKPFDAAAYLFAGELALDGSLRPVPGVLALALLAEARGIPNVVVPVDNAAEAAVVRTVRVLPVGTLEALIRHLEGLRPIEPAPPTEVAASFPRSCATFDQIHGLRAAKRALTVAAAGGHNVLLSGPPGTGKTLLAQAFASLLPPPTLPETLEITQIWSAAGLTGREPLIATRPFRSPHHSTSSVAVLGGGAIPRPGEISLAHRGVLFLDELPEFHRDVLEGLRQPLEDGSITVARAKQSLVFPARFTLIAAMNPCPCGYFEDPDRECRCTAHEVLRYQRKISGPLLDRIDMHLDVPRTPIEELRAHEHTGSTETDRARAEIAGARNRQLERFRGLSEPVFANSELRSHLVDKLIELTPAAETLVKQTIEHAFLSPRGYYRTLKVAQTIADLDGAALVDAPHLAEAFQYRLRIGS